MGFVWRYPLATLFGLSAAIGILATVASLFFVRPLGEALFALDACRRVNLIDDGLSWTVTGIEDLTIDREREIIYLSAYDRQAVENAVRAGSVPPQGGLYRLPLTSVTGADTTKVISVKGIIDRTQFPNGLRPHGISFDPDTNTLSFLNRGFTIRGEDWERKVTLVKTPLPAAREFSETPVHCAANDITTFLERTIETRDHGRCAAVWVEDIFSLRRGSVGVAGAEEPIETGLSFPNGIVTVGNGLVFAATRARTLHWRGASTGQGLNFIEAFDTPVPGGPDNLTVNPDDSIVVALHPSLPRMGLQRKLGFGRSPSRVIRLENLGRKQLLLFEDPYAKQFSAVTVAVEHENVLILGSVMEPGLMICRRSA